VENQSKGRLTRNGVRIFMEQLQAKPQCWRKYTNSHTHSVRQMQAQHKGSLGRLHFLHFIICLCISLQMPNERPFSLNILQFLYLELPQRQHYANWKHRLQLYALHSTGQKQLIEFV